MALVTVPTQEPQVIPETPTVIFEEDMMADIHFGVVIMVWSCRSSGWQNKIWEIDVRRSGDVIVRSSDGASRLSVDTIGGTTTSDDGTHRDAGRQTTP